MGFFFFFSFNLLLAFSQVLVLSNRTFCDTGNVLYLCLGFSPRNCASWQQIIHSFIITLLFYCVFPSISINLTKRAGKARGNSHTEGDIRESQEQWRGVFLQDNRDWSCGRWNATDKVSKAWNSKTKFRRSQTQLISKEDIQGTQHRHFI